MESHSFRTFRLSTFLALGLAVAGHPSTAQALTILYQHTLTRPTLTDPPITFFDPRLMLFEPVRTAITTDIAHEFQDLEQSNCIANEGCYGNILASVAFIRPDGVRDPLPEGNLPERFIFRFPMDPGIKEAIFKADGFGKLTVVAARDLGISQGEMQGAFIRPTGGATAEPLRDLFRTTRSTCPPGENVVVQDIPDGGEEKIVFVKDTTCGPNYHTDVTATDSSPISHDRFLRILGTTEPGDIDIVLTPLDVPGDFPGRVKIFSVTLTYVVPQPSTLILTGTGLAGLAWWRRGARKR